MIDFLVEIFLEVYIELMLFIVPEKNISKKHKTIAKIIAIAVLLGVIALLFWGIVLISDYENYLGVIPIAVAAIISALQITLGIILYKKNH